MSFMNNNMLKNQFISINGTAKSWTKHLHEVGKIMVNPLNELTFH